MTRLLLIATTMLGSCVTMDNAKSQDVILLKANIESLGEPREIPSQGNEVNIGAVFKARLDKIMPLIGQLRSSSVEVDLAMASSPKNYQNRETYVLLRKEADGNFRALAWDYVEGGLCIPRDMAKAYSIEDDLTQLRQSGGVKWKPGCDW